MLGRSVHVGLDRVDATAYEGWDGLLTGCANDARSMLHLAASTGHQPLLLLNEDATAARVLEALSEAARSLTEGDHLLVSYSGHGADVPHVDDPGRRAATLALFDRMLLEAELDAMVRKFAAGVRVLFVTDTCRSGAAVDRVRWFADARRRGARVRSKNMPDDVLAMLIARHRDRYDKLQRRAMEQQPAASQCTIRFSACQEDQLAQDGDTHGIFTEQLLATWQGGAFRGDHHAFLRALGERMPPGQTPRIDVADGGGADTAAFMSMRPFVLVDDTPEAPPRRSTRARIDEHLRARRTHGQ